MRRVSLAHLSVSDNYSFAYFNVMGVDDEIIVHSAQDAIHEILRRFNDPFLEICATFHYDNPHVGVPVQQSVLYLNPSRDAKFIKGESFHDLDCSRLAELIFSYEK